MDPAVTDLGSEVHMIDTQMGGFAGITAAYLIRSDHPALVETGAGLSAGLVADALRRLGVGPQELRTIVVTHIHLDHAGGVGDLAAAFPNAEIVVHERGARHLVDPARLEASARQVYGPLMDTLFGALTPTPQERVRTVGDSGVIDLGGGRVLSTSHSPGHASHHVGLLDSLSGDLYVGDAAGIYVPEADVVRPATPPPDFDLPLALASLRAFTALRPQRLLFSHYGPAGAVDEILQRSAEELEVWVEMTRETRRQGLDLDHAVASVREQTLARYAALRSDVDLDGRQETLNGTRANLVGIQRWLDRAEPASGRADG